MTSQMMRGHKFLQEQEKLWSKENEMQKRIIHLREIKEMISTRKCVLCKIYYLTLTRFIIRTNFFIYFERDQKLFKESILTFP
jgi:hypothetical protein